MMSMDYVKGMGQTAAMPIVSVIAQVIIAVRVKEIPVNPSDIITINGPEFTVDMKKMDAYAPCIVEIAHLRYMVWKDENGSLIINEVT